MGSRRQVRRLVAGLSVAVLVGCAASTTATPAGAPDAGDGTGSAAYTGDWKDQLEGPTSTGTGDWKDSLE
jgi:hypothetical protein